MVVMLVCVRICVYLFVGVGVVRGRKTIKHPMDLATVLMEVQHTCSSPHLLPVTPPPAPAAASALRSTTINGDSRLDRY